MIRPRVAALVLVLAIFSLLGLRRARHQLDASKSSLASVIPAAGGVDAVASSTVDRPMPQTQAPAMMSPPDSSAASGVSPAELAEAYVDQRIIELNELAMEDDAASLEAILAELENREPRIRQAALDAAIQFGDRAAIPRMQQVAEQTSDPLEKAALLKGVEFLKLTNLDEALSQMPPSASAKVGKVRSP